MSTVNETGCAEASSACVGGWGCNYERFLDERCVVVQARTRDPSELMPFLESLRHGDIVFVDAKTIFMVAETTRSELAEMKQRLAALGVEAPDLADIDDKKTAVSEAASPLPLLPKKERPDATKLMLFRGDQADSVCRLVQICDPFVPHLRVFPYLSRTIEDPLSFFAAAFESMRVSHELYFCPTAHWNVLWSRVGGRRLDRHCQVWWYGNAREPPYRCGDAIFIDTPPCWELPSHHSVPFNLDTPTVYLTDPRTPLDHDPLLEAAKMLNVRVYTVSIAAYFNDLKPGDRIQLLGIPSAEVPGLDDLLISGDCEFVRLDLPCFRCGKLLDSSPTVPEAVPTPTPGPDAKSSSLAAAAADDVVNSDSKRKPTTRRDKRRQVARQKEATALENVRAAIKTKVRNAPPHVCSGFSHSDLRELSSVLCLILNKLPPGFPLPRVIVRDWEPRYGRESQDASSRRKYFERVYTPQVCTAVGPFAKVPVWACAPSLHSHLSGFHRSRIALPANLADSSPGKKPKLSA